MGGKKSYYQISRAQRLIGAFRAQYTLCQIFLKNSKDSHSLRLFFGQKWKNNDFLLIWLNFLLGLSLIFKMLLSISSEKQVGLKNIYLKNVERNLAKKSAKLI